MRNAVESHNRERFEIQPTGTQAGTNSPSPIREQGETSSETRSRADLLADLAHDLRTPFVAIRGYTKMILEGRAGPINSTQHEYLSVVLENANRASQLLNELLALATVESPRAEKVDLCDLWKEARETMQPPILTESPRITERILNAPLRVVGDRRSLKKVLAAMLSSALKFTDPGAEVFVELSNLRRSLVTVRIFDAKGEMPAKLLDTVWRCVTANLNNHENPSDDLALVHEIVQSHGGRFSVVNTEETGAGFFLSLPALEAGKP